jgi:predicted nuclease of restriction endonuclease-like (RecB) superfamily
MKRFYEFYHDADEKLRRSVAVSSESQILRRSVAESSNAVQSQESVSPDYPRPPHYVDVLPWRHNLLIMSKIKDVEEALYYAESAAIMGWTRDILLNFIKADTYHTAKVLPNQPNFDRTLPEHLQEQTNEMLKATLNLGFLGIKQPFKERELEKRIVEKIRLFMLELGEGFTFIGNQHHLTLGKKDYYVDLLFFNRKIRSLVAIDLKIGEFQPEYAGKMNHYLGLLDDQMRMPDENPSIGIIFCAEKDNIEVEVSLRDINKPIGVAEYRLLFPEDEIKAMIKRELKNSARSTTKH